MNAPPIIVDGDSYQVAFLLPAHSLRFPAAELAAGWDTGRSLLLPVEFGSHFLAEVARDVAGPAAALQHVASKHFLHLEAPQQLFHLECGSEKEDVLILGSPGKKMPYLRAGGGEPYGCFEDRSPTARAAPPSTDEAVLLHWIAQPRYFGREHLDRGLPAEGPKCFAHVQVGRLAAPQQAIGPGQLARPTHVRFLVLHLHELFPNTRVRKSLSYESIAVDLLRRWRGCDSKLKLERTLTDLVKSANEPAALLTCVVVCINDAACLVYCPHDGERERALLLFQGRMAAPMLNSKLGSVDAYIASIASHVAVEYAGFATGTSKPGDCLKEGLNDGGWLCRALLQALRLQSAQGERGLFMNFFHRESAAGGWAPITSADWSHRRVNMKDARDWLDHAARPKDKAWRVEVHVHAAVSHRSQWFITSDIVEPDREKLKGSFLAKAIHWLTNREDTKPADEIPLVKIGNLELLDRREVEDYLAIRDAFRNYRPRAARPLNIAVFGAPGSGKSYGVKQVVEHMAEDGRFSKEARTFNVSQFTDLADLVNALHQVRSEALKPGIPVIFFDEFDSAFEGRPFGWLRYFLAPMQDGEFIDGGTTYKLGDCVLVFAGGVTRSFEELNGRLRNPSFVEAKGPDFISRLRAHLNIRGINKPEDELDQQRYILRRAIMLHRLLLQRLKRPNGTAPRPLVEQAVANAFCTIAAFKHGPRSLEAILDMCNLQRGRTFGPADLPGKSQLEMHVDAAKFLELVYGPD